MRPSRAGQICLFLSFIGLGIAGYLEFLHIALLRGELIGGVACGASGSAFNCHAVTASRFGSFLGIPLALWGVLGYLAAATLAFIASEFPNAAVSAMTGLSLLSLLFVVVDLALLAAMAFVIRYFCPLCLATYGINVLLFLIATWGTARPLGEIIGSTGKTLGEWVPRIGAALPSLLWGVVLVGLLGIVALNTATLYVARGSSAGFRKQMSDFVGEKKRVTVDTQGDPTHGPANPTLRIVEFSDFLCPSCQRASQFNPIMLAGHRDASFTFKNFPLDQACNAGINRTVHPSACQVAAAGECANEQGKFWPMHDIFFKAGPEYKVADLDSDAQKVGLDMSAFKACMDSGRGLEAVKRDTAEGNRINVTRTPTYIVDGVVVEGLLNPVMADELFAILEREKPR